MTQVLWVGFGDIGQRTSPQLLHHGYRVTGARRSPSKSIISATHDIVRGDATTAEAWCLWLADRPQMIILTLTPSSYTAEGYQSSYFQPVQKMLSELEQMKNYQPVIYFISSTSVYGNEDGSWVSEETAAVPAGFSGQTMLACEQLLQASPYAGAILRCSGIYGPGRTRMLESVRSQTAVLRNEWTNRVHADDIARAIVFLCTRAATTTVMEVFNLTDDEPTIQAEVVTWLANELDIDIRQLDVDNLTSSRGSKRISNQKIKALGFTFTYPNFKRGYQTLINNE